MNRIQCLQRVVTLSFVALVFAVAPRPSQGDEPQSQSTPGTAAPATQAAAMQYKPKTADELRRTLSPIQFQVTQEEGTEPPFRNSYWDNKKEGSYHCIVCERKLFESETKYKSGTGWPSFFAPVDKKAVGFRVDHHLKYPRTEVHCSRCNAHLGHVFDDGPRPTGKRYCMNSASLKFAMQQKPTEKSMAPAKISLEQK